MKRSSHTYRSLNIPMPLDFHANPSVNDTYTFDGKTWIWAGIMFRVKFAERFAGLFDLGGKIPYTRCD